MGDHICPRCRNLRGEIRGLVAVDWPAPNDVQPDRWDWLHGLECPVCDYRRLLWVDALISEQTRVERKLPSLAWRAEEAE